MRYALTRIVVGIVIGLALMFAHKLARAYPAAGGGSSALSSFKEYSTNAGSTYPYDTFSEAVTAYCVGKADCGTTGSATSWYSASACADGLSEPAAGAYSNYICYRDLPGGAGSWYGNSRVLARVATSCPPGTTPSGGNCVAPYTCPGGGTLSGATCTCAPGDTDTGSSCIAPCAWPKAVSGGSCACPASGQDPYMASTFTNGVLNDASWPMAGGSCTTNRPSTACVGGAGGSGCQMNVNWDAANRYSVSGTTCSGAYAPSQMTFTGASCSSASGTNGDIPTQNDANDQPIPCAPGMVGGTVNGVYRCLPGQTQGTGTETGTTNTTLPDGTTVATTVTENSVTNCSGPGSCSTTTTTTTTTVSTPPGGPPQTTTTTETETEPGDGTELGGFCEQNPGSPICKSSSWSGACAATQCEGDAIQCAIAREQHRRFCEILNPVATGAQPADAQTFWDANSKGEGIAKALIHTDGTLPTMDQTSRGLSGGGLSDVTYSMGMIGNVTIPYSNLNNILNIIGGIVLALALIIGARIFYNGAMT